MFGGRLDWSRFLPRAAWRVGWREGGEVSEFVAAMRMRSRVVFALAAIRSGTACGRAYANDGFHAIRRSTKADPPWKETILLKPCDQPWAQAWFHRVVDRAGAAGAAKAPCKPRS